MSQDLRVCVTDLEDTPTDGFSPEVASTVASFLDVWAGEGAKMAKGAEGLSEDLRDLLRNFAQFEYSVADELSKASKDIG